MNIKRISLFIIFCLITIFVSCKSNSVEKENMIFIMVYDYDSKEVNDVEIYVDSKCIGRTDIYGRFILPKEDTYKELILKKLNYEDIKVIINEDINQFLYIKMGSASYYAHMSEKFLDQKEYQKANDFIKKALTINDRKDYRLLEKIILKGIENE